MRLLDNTRKLYRNVASRYYNRLEAKVWKERLESALSTFDKSELPVVEILLANQIAQLKQSHQYDPTNEVKVRNARDAQAELIFDVVVEVCRQLKQITPIVGLQPMQGPAGLAYRMSYLANPDNPSHARLSVYSQTVGAKSRPLQSRWTVEPRNDLTSHLDMRSEIIQALAREVMAELSAEIVQDLEALARDSCTIVSTGDELLTALMATANDIGRKTRRGIGNFIVTSPTGCSLLSKYAGSNFVAAESETISSPASVVFVGTLNRTIKVYSSIASEVSNATVNFCVGYKSTGSEIDTGLFFHPYVMLIAGGVNCDPITFQIGQTLMTRYGKTMFEATEDMPTSSKDYYGTVQFTLPGVEQPKNKE
jgi:hypothetical protein